MYPRVHEGCWATVASSQNCETISGHYKSYYGTSHLYHGFLRCMGFVPSCSCMSSLGLHPREDIQLPLGTNPIHLETHGTNDNVGSAGIHVQAVEVAGDYCNRGTLLYIVDALGTG